MDIFVSSPATVIAKNIAFICRSLLADLLVLAVYDEDVLVVEHVLTLVTVLGAAVAGARVFIPDENQVFCPERTLPQVGCFGSFECLDYALSCPKVVAHIHYFPVQWRG